MNYEEMIRTRAERHGLKVVRENGGLTVSDAEDRTAWHRLGGRAEEMFNERVKDGSEPLAPGRWLAPNGEGVPSMCWVDGLR